jgi:hypothetical protein
MYNPFRKRRQMSVNNKPRDDAKAMTDEYITGATIDSIALKYNHTAEEVEAIVTHPVGEETQVTQAELDNTPAEPKAEVITKKDK